MYECICISIETLGDDEDINSTILGISISYGSDNFINLYPNVEKQDSRNKSHNKSNILKRDLNQDDYDILMNDDRRIDLEMCDQIFNKLIEENRDIWFWSVNEYNTLKTLFPELSKINCLCYKTFCHIFHEKYNKSRNIEKDSTLMYKNISGWKIV